MGIALRAALVLAVAAAAGRAEAFPAFARKYGMSCSACHVAWPILNQVGDNFRDNGYQFLQGKDDPVTVTPGFLPISLRTTPAYQYTRSTNAPELPRPMTVQHGGVPLPPGVDIFAGGVIADDVSFLVVLTGFGPDGKATVESAWARLDQLGGSRWLNLRVGRFELDLPASPHRTPTLTAGHAAYSALPQGSLLGRNPDAAFDLGANHVGLELAGHDEKSSLRYALSFTSASGGEALSDSAWSSPFVHLHLTRSFDFASPAFPWLRLGLLGGIGWWPTRFETGGGGIPIDGTGTAAKQFVRAGAEIAWVLGYPSTPAQFTVAYLRGQESKGLAAGIDPYRGVDLALTDNSFDSAFVDLAWAPVAAADYNAVPWLLFARADWVRFQRGTGDTAAATLGLRRYLALGPRASASIHLEGHVEQVRGRGLGAGSVPVGDAVIRNLTRQDLLAGIDIAF